MVGDILQPTHLLLILVVALVVLGPKRLPEVGRTLGTGLRDFKAAINGESVHEDRPPHAFVEQEPDPVPPLDSNASDAEPAGFDFSREESAEPDDAEHEPATPTALHDQPVDLQADGVDLYAPAAYDDLRPPAASDDLPDAAEPDSPVAAGSSSGFASALASSRQRPAGGEPAADDE